MRIHRKDKEFTTTRIIAVGFLATIITGTILLMLPISSASGESTNVLDSLFTATTSVCVTGLVTVPTYAHWSLFGQIIIALLAQIGGLGIITFTMMFMLALGRRIGLKQRLLIQDAYNLDTIQGMVVMVKKIVKGTLLVEGIGALLTMTVLVPEFGWIGIWKSIFHAISAFCNAGMDVIGPDSLLPYQGNFVMNVTTMALIVFGGIGFPVWWSVQWIIQQRRKKHQTWRVALHCLPLHTKIVISFTFVLLIAGGVVVFVLEYSNPETLGNLSLWDKIQASLFQSVTTRTAGFLTISQKGMRNATALICCLLMFVGGSPSGTAGGVKTTTVAILVLTVSSIIKGRKDTEIFGRKINGNIVRRSLSIVMVSFGVLMLALIALVVVQPGDFLDCMYEVVSAIATVGLSRDFTATMNTAGKIIIIIVMYIGRIGPISLALFFNSKRFVNLKTYPEERVSVG